MTILQIRKLTSWGAWVAQAVKCLPSGQVMISGSGDGAPHWVPCSVGSLVLPLPLPTTSLFVHARSLSLCQINKSLKKEEEGSGSEGRVAWGLANTWRVLEREPWSWLGQGQRQIPFFASKSIITSFISFQCLRPLLKHWKHSCQHLPGACADWFCAHWKGRPKELGRGRKVQTWSRFCGKI